MAREEQGRNGQRNAYRWWIVKLVERFFIGSADIVIGSLKKNPLFSAKMMKKNRPIFFIENKTRFLWRQLPALPIRSFDVKTELSTTTERSGDGVSTFSLYSSLVELRNASIKK